MIPPEEFRYPNLSQDKDLWARRKKLPEPILVLIRHFWQTYFENFILCVCGREVLANLLSRVERFCGCGTAFRGAGTSFDYLERNCIMKDTSSIGNHSQGQVLAALMRKSKTVLIPFGDAGKYDLVFEDSNGFQRVQIKTGLYKDGAVQFRTYTVKRRNGVVINENYGDEIDYFGVYCPQLNKTYLVPMKEISTIKGAASLRVDPTNQINRIRYAKEYEI